MTDNEKLHEALVAQMEYVQALQRHQLLWLKWILATCPEKLPESGLPTEDIANASNTVNNARDNAMSAYYAAMPGILRQ